MLGDKGQFLLIVLFCLSLSISTLGVACTSSENWIEVTRFTGSGTEIRKTDYFTCNQSEWRIRWEYIPDSQYSGLISFSVYTYPKMEGTRGSTPTNVINKIGTEDTNGTSNIHDYPGTFYLYINNVGTESYTIIVEQSSDFIPDPPSESTIHIRPDGSVDGTNKIQRDGNVYTFTGNIFGSIVVEKDDVVIDGADHSLQGNGSRFGIDISERSNVIIKNTQVDSFDYGIYVENSLNILVTRNNITNNTYGIDLVSSSRNNSISRNYVANNEVFGIRLYFCLENEILENNITTNNLSGILLYFSENNTLSKNSITANEWGINLYGSGYNNLSGNSITNNKIGLWFFGSSHNNMFSNNITDNQRSMYFEMQAFDNMIYHNNVIDNVQQVFTDIDSVNVWDNGDEGNYWSNYNGTDNDSNEIGDTPYIIDQNNQDNYPVINLILSDSPPKNGPSNPDPFSNLPSAIIEFITSGIGLLLLTITTVVVGLIVILVLVLNRKRKSLEVVK